MAAALVFVPQRPLRASEPLRSLLQWLLASAIGIGALFLLACVLGFVFSFGWGGGGAFDEPGTWISGTLVFGIPLVVLYGAPAYVILLRLGRARWIHVVLVGLAPSTLFLILNPLFGAVAVFCGSAVALATHLCMHWRVQFVRTNPAA